MQFYKKFLVKSTCCDQEESTIISIPTVCTPYENRNVTGVVTGRYSGQKTYFKIRLDDAFVTQPDTVQQIEIGDSEILYK